MLRWIVGLAVVLALAWFLVEGTGSDRSRPDANALKPTETPAVETVPSSAPLEPVVDATVPREERSLPIQPTVARPVLEGVVLENFVRTLADAQVALFFVEEGAPQSRAIPAWQGTDDQGRFRIDLDEEVFGRDVLLAAKAEGFQTWSQPLFLERGGAREPSMIFMDPGVSISGRIVRDGVPLQGLDVWLVREGAAPSYGSREPVWMRDHFDGPTIRTALDRDGSFEFRGLRPFPYRISFRPPGLCLPSVQEHVLSAPTRGRTIDVSPGRLDVRVLSGEEPVAEARITASAATDQRVFMSEVGGTELLVDPGTEVVFEVTHASSLPVQTTWLAPGPGEERDVTLELQVIERPALALRLIGPQAADVTFLSLEILSVPTGEVLSISVPRSGEEFVVDPLGLDPGTCRLRVQCRDAGSYVFSDERTIQLPESGRVEVELLARLGGRIELVQRDHANWIPVRLLDSTGRDVLSLPVLRNPTVNHHPLVMVKDRTFEPGSYRLEVLSPLHEPFQRDVTVQAGRTVKVVVELVPGEGSSTDR